MALMYNLYQTGKNKNTGFFSGFQTGFVQSRPLGLEIIESKSEITLRSQTQLMPEAFQGQKIWEHLYCKLDKVNTSATENCNLGISSTLTENLNFSFILENYGLITALTMKGQNLSHLFLSTLNILSKQYHCLWHNSQV